MGTNIQVCKGGLVMDKKELVCDSVAILSTAIQPDRTLQIISMILTILSLTLSLIIKLKNWYRQAKADRKITKEELNEAVEITKDGIEKINETIKEHKDE